MERQVAQLDAEKQPPPMHHIISHMLYHSPTSLVFVHLTSYSGLDVSEKGLTLRHVRYEGARRALNASWP